MAYPSPKEIEKMLKKLEKAEPTFVIDKNNASASELLKYELCNQFVRYMRVNKVTQAELARQLEIDKAVMNKIVLHRIWHFTSDRLIDLLSKLRPVTIKLGQ